MIKSKRAWDPNELRGLSREFCLRWGRNWRKTALVALGVFWVTFFLILSTILTSPVPPPVLGYVVWAGGSLYLLWVTLDSTLRSRAYYRRAKFLERVEHAEINALRGALDLGETRWGQKYDGNKLV